MSGPLLIASNHPNSFLDAVIFDILFQQPIWSLTRGDVFKPGFIRRLLHALKMMPVYRIREGSANLNTNYQTFENCMQLFQQKGMVLIFSEGFCVNEWHLRPLKKGTARLAFMAWEKSIPLKVLPVGINYSSFNKYGKKIIINFGDCIEAQLGQSAISDGEKHLLFNKTLTQKLQQLVFEIDNNDAVALENKFGKVDVSTKFLLALPAWIGALLHLPLYSVAKTFTRFFFGKTDHYDSVMFGFLLFTYPLYLIMLSILASVLTSSICALVVIFAVPFFAWCCAKYDVRKG